MPLLRFSTAALLFGAACALSSLAQAQPTVYINNLAPFVYTENGAQQGVVYELMQLLARRRAYQGAIIAAPIKRRAAQLDAQADSFGVLWRMPDNESDFTWLFRLLDDPIRLLARSDSTVDISSIDKARNLHIGVILGGPSESVARRLGFTHIEAIASVNSNALKLQARRIDAWLGIESLATYAERDGGMQFRRGPVVGSASLYFACGRQCSASEAQKWTEAYNSIKADGSMNAILLKYHFH